MSTKWFGKRYPMFQDLEMYAESQGASIVFGHFPAAFLPEGAGGPIIFLPDTASGLEKVWLLAHEIGHLLQHSGKAPLMHGKQEFRADHWAACALIPLERILDHRNASEDAFVGALSAHFEDIPPEDCQSRRLAGEIARIRLRSLAIEVA
jgi:hypothetical protein